MRDSVLGALVALGSWNVDDRTAVAFIWFLLGAIFVLAVIFAVTVFNIWRSTRTRKKVGKR